MSNINPELLLFNFEYEWDRYTLTELRTNNHKKQWMATKGKFIAITTIHNRSKLKVIPILQKHYCYWKIHCGYKATKVRLAQITNAKVALVFYQEQAHTIKVNSRPWNCKKWNTHRQQQPQHIATWSCCEVPCVRIQQRTIYVSLYLHPFTPSLSSFRLHHFMGYCYGITVGPS